MKLTNTMKDFVPAPDGEHNAVCVDVVDLGMVEGSWKGKKTLSHKLRIVWQLETKMENGKPFLVQQRYTASTAPQANLRLALAEWRGRDFTPEELNEFDLENIIGANCRLTVKHTAKDGKIYANVTTLFKPKIKLTVQDYTRVQDREGYVAPAMPDEQAHPDPEPQKDSDSDIPF